MFKVEFETQHTIQTVYARRVRYSQPYGSGVRSNVMSLDIFTTEGHQYYWSNVFLLETNFDFDRTVLEYDTIISGVGVAPKTYRIEIMRIPTWWDKLKAMIC